MNHKDKILLGLLLSLAAGLAATTLIFENSNKDVQTDDDLNSNLTSLCRPITEDGVLNKTVPCDDANPETYSNLTNTTT